MNQKIIYTLTDEAPALATYSLLPIIQAYTRAAEECLVELRSSQPAPGFERVEIPGEREQALFEKRTLTGIPIPVATLHSLRRLGESYGVDASGL